MNRDLKKEPRTPSVGSTDAAAIHRRAVLVLGMHRSGTSALARVTNLLGCDLPAKLMEPNWSNVAGHWESTAIMRLNDDLLASAGSKWDDWSKFNPRWLSSPRAEEFRQRAQQVLAEEYGASSLFVLKDPRICRFAKFWIDALESFGARPVVIFPLRNPLEVAASIEKRNGIAPAFSHLLWLRHVLDAEHDSRGLPRWFTTYDRLLEGLSGGIVKEAEVALELSWPGLSQSTVFEIEDFLNNDLRHHREAQTRLTKNPTISRWLRQSFGILSRWAESGSSDADFSELDRIRSHFDEAAPAFARLVATGREHATALEVARAKTTELTQALQEKEQIVQEKDQSIKENIERVEGLRSQLDEAAKERSQVDEFVKEVQAQILERTNERDQHATALEVARAETTELTQALQEKEQIVQEKDRFIKENIERVEGLQLQLDEAAKERSQVDEFVKGVRAQILERTNERDQYENQRDQLQERLEALQAQLDAATAVAAEEREALQKRTKERDQFEEQSRANAEAADALSRKMESRIEEIGELTKIIRGTEVKANQLAAGATVLVRHAAVAAAGYSLGTTPWTPAIKKIARRLVAANVVDQRWYLERNGDVAEASIGGAEHYLMYGFAEGREPRDLTEIERPAVSPECSGAGSGGISSKVRDQLRRLFRIGDPC